MVGALIVEPNKNEFLLYAMLNTLGLMRGNPDSHFLRRKTVDHFKGYEGMRLRQKKYTHHSKPASYVLTISDAPDFSKKKNIYLNSCMKNEVKIGKKILPYLKHFYKNTDFEEFYQEILPRYKEECEFLQGVLDNAKVRELLDDVWEVKESFNMCVIPMPLEGFMAGVGPSIGNTAYQIVGPPFDYRSLHLVAHEGSHPRAKRTLAPIAKEIFKKNHLVRHALKQPNYPESYSGWSICFEEHFIRAIQAGYIDSVLSNIDIEERLIREEKDYGMIFIRDFYEEIKNHKKISKGNLEDVAIRILNRLDSRYK
jgi:hypothetical protein